MKIDGRVIAGKLTCDLPAAWAIMLREFDGQAVEVVIEKKRERRSNRANARYWTVLVPLARHALNLKRGPELLPLSKDQTHYLLVTAFGASEETELGSVPIRSSTMTTKQFFHLTEQVTLWLSEQGYEVPTGPEVSVAEAMEAVA